MSEVIRLARVVGTHTDYRLYISLCVKKSVNVCGCMGVCVRELMWTVEGHGLPHRRYTKRLETSGNNKTAVLLYEETLTMLPTDVHDNIMYVILSR